MVDVDVALEVPVVLPIDQIAAGTDLQAQVQLADASLEHLAPTDQHGSADAVVDEDLRGFQHAPGLPFGQHDALHIDLHAVEHRPHDHAGAEHENAQAASVRIEALDGPRRDTGVHGRARDGRGHLEHEPVVEGLGHEVVAPEAERAPARRPPTPHRKPRDGVLAHRVHHAVDVAHADVLELQTHERRQVQARERRRARAGAHHRRVLEPLVRHAQPVPDRRRHDDGRAVLVVVEHRDVHALAQPLLDLEALRRLDVLEVEAAEARPHQRDRVDEAIDVGGVELEIATRLPRTVSSAACASSAAIARHAAATPGD